MTCRQIIWSLVQVSTDGESPGSSFNYDLSDITNQLTDLRLETSHLHAELTRLRQQYDDVTRHVFNTALHIGSSSQLTRDDVSKLIDKMSALMNRSAGHHSQLQGAKHGHLLPIGLSSVTSLFNF
jgi:2-phospho-L-lactate transferase/gluconeogenesis factor (CofD/UPF0052 family)